MSALGYGTRLASVLAGVIGGALSTAALPRLARYAVTEDGAGMRAALWKYGRFVLSVIVPGTLGLVALSGVIVSFVFERGAVTAAVADLIASVQRWSLLQLPFVVFTSVMLRMIAALRVNHLVLWVGALGLILNVALDFLLKQQMGLAGIALASSLVQLATAGCVLMLVKNRIPSAK